MQIHDVNTEIEKCEDVNTKLFVLEAVKAYNAGAYRACINNTWLAIVVNVVYKIEQLALLGDKEAVAQKDLLDKIKKNNNISEMLKFEKNVLDVACEKLELYDGVVKIDLERVREDRNRCSHPLLNLDNKPFSPDAELARHHLIVALEKLLLEGNVFGKSAIEKIMALVNSPVFPIHYKDCKKVLQNSYLGSPKESLIASLMNVLVKEILRGSLDLRRICIHCNVIRFLLDKYRGFSEKCLSESLVKVLDCSDEKQLKNMRHLFRIDSYVWTAITETNQIMVRNYVRSLPSESFEDVEDWLVNPDLKDCAEIRIRCATRDELMNYSSFGTPYEIRKRIMQIYLSSGSFAQANDFASTLVDVLYWAEREELENFVSKIHEHSQVMGSNTLPYVLSKVKEAGKYSDEEFDALLKKNFLFKLKPC